MSQAKKYYLWRLKNLNGFTPQTTFSTSVFPLSGAAQRGNQKPFRISLVKRLDDTIQQSEKVRLLKVDERDFATASFLRNNPEIIPTLTDWTSLVLMARNKIFKILTFDRHFSSARRIPEFRNIQQVDEVPNV